jgi:Rps23 Pro-64 3,4-dihydroxylase Tpa1-like proline 4-hydroxylase
MNSFKISETSENDSKTLETFEKNVKTLEAFENGIKALEALETLENDSKALELIPAFYFDQEYLQDLAEKHREAFAKATPFPHAVIDNFLPENIIELLAKEFPNPDKIKWKLEGPGDAKHTGSKYVEKISASDEKKFGNFTRHFMGQLNSNVFVKFIESLTGFENLAPDPSFRAAGMHSTGRGGRLMIHNDAASHANPKFHQTLNFILYLNPDWQEEWGGHLELWNKDATQSEQKILPIYNRCVVFYTGTNTYHGFPIPLTCPEDRRRNSLGVYYFTVDRPIGEDYKYWKNYVDWIPTIPEDRSASLMHKLKGFARRTITPRYLNSLTRIYRDVSGKS